MSAKKFFSHKTNVIYISALMLAICGLVIIFYLLRGAKIETISKQDVDRVVDNGGVEKLLSNNRATLEQAGKGRFQNVRAIDESDKTWQEKKEDSIDLIVYTDFDCKFCADTHEMLKVIQSEYEGKLNIAIRHFPMRQHTNSFLAAVATECAGKEGQFFAAIDDFFVAVDNESQGYDHIMSLPERLDLNKEKFEECLDDGEINNFVTEQIQEARKFGVLGTPAMFIGSESIAGAVPLEDFVDSSGREREGMRSIVERHLRSGK